MAKELLFDANVLGNAICECKNRDKMVAMVCERNEDNDFEMFLQFQKDNNETQKIFCQNLDRNYLNSIIGEDFYKEFCKISYLEIFLRKCDGYLIMDIHAGDIYLYNFDIS